MPTGLPGTGSIKMRLKARLTSPTIHCPGTSSRKVHSRYQAYHRVMRGKLVLLWTLSILCPARFVAGQQDVQAVRPVQPAWPELQSFLDQISTLRVEYRSDLGLSVIRQAHDAVPRGIARNFLDDLFYSAHTASYQTAFVYAASNHEISSKALEADSLFMKRVDALSIQANVVEEMLWTSPEAAAERFTEIRLSPQRATCADSLVQDLSPYYETLKLLFADLRVRTFGAEPRAQYLLDRFNEALTPEQIVPLLTVLPRLELEQEDFQAALQIAANNLEHMHASARELTVLNRKLYIAIQYLSSHADQSQLSLTNLLVAYRTFLVANAMSHTCAGDPDTRKLTSGNLNEFLSRLRSQGSVSVISPISIEDAPISDRGAPALDPRVFTFGELSATVNELLTDVNSLPKIQTSTPATEEEVAAAMATLTKDNVSTDCDFCVFQGYIRLFDGLIWQQPSGNLVRTLLSSEVKYLSKNSMEEKNPAAFLVPLKSLIETSRASSVPPSSVLSGSRFTGSVMRRSSAPKLSIEPTFLREQLLLSDDPIISVYMKYETMFPRQ